MHVEVFRYLFRYFWDSKFGKNVKTFGFDMILSVHVDNKKDILILFKGPTQGLDNTTLALDKIYPINMSEQHKKFCLSLGSNGFDSYIFVNGIEICKFKAKDFEINAAPLGLCNVSIDDLECLWTFSWFW